MDFFRKLKSKNTSQAEQEPLLDCSTWTCGRCKTQVDLLKNANDVIFLGAYEGVAWAGNIPCCHAICRSCLVWLFECSGVPGDHNQLSYTYNNPQVVRKSGIPFCSVHLTQPTEHTLFCPFDKTSVMFYISFFNDAISANYYNRYAIHLLATRAHELFQGRAHGVKMGDRYPLLRLSPVKDILKDWIQSPIIDSSLALKGDFDVEYLNKDDLSWPIGTKAPADYFEDYSSV